MEKTIHLMVTEGPASGREIHVPPEGVRIGRSSRNDISIADDIMSRFQCRFFMKPGEGLWISDLGSVNGTFVGGVPVQEQRLNLHEEIVAGGTRFRVVNTGEVVLSAGEPVSGFAAEGVVTPSPHEPTLDLGLKKQRVVKEGNSTATMRRKLVWVAGAMILMVVAVWTPWGKLGGVLSWDKKPLPQPPQEAVVTDLELSFERVEGSVSNIFRYLLDVRDGSLAVQVDDLQGNRHVRREKKVLPELIRDLARSLQATGVVSLREDYSGLAPGIYESSDLSITMGLNTRRIKVLNHIEPEEFAAARSMIEEFGKNELGLAALAIDPATLVAKAKDSLLQAKKMWDEREVRDENMFNSIRAYKECEWYLETIEPKPDFYAVAVSAKTDCERELQRRYDDLWFVAERAVKLRDWKVADRQLKVICDMIPDRSDKRNQEAVKKLVDVQRHLETEK
ncbi:MAG: FHA domain-containing protein [bacterium]